MSGRNSNNNSKKKDSTPDLEGSHLQELNIQHRQFLVRSLGRNDTDLAALLTVNVSLTKLKAQLLQACGELVLLDLGSGRLSLLDEKLHFHRPKQPQPQQQQSQKEGEGSASSQTGGVGVEYTLTPIQTQLCIDFLLRMKLRRKLGNRLIRRLNRIAHAMDGVDIHPPPPPRYGDLRLHVTSDAIQEFIEHQNRITTAKKWVEEHKDEQQDGTNITTTLTNTTTTATTDATTTTETTPTTDGETVPEVPTEKDQPTVDPPLVTSGGNESKEVSNDDTKKEEEKEKEDKGKTEEAEEEDKGKTEEKSSGENKPVEPTMEEDSKEPTSSSSPPKQEETTTEKSTEDSTKPTPTPSAPPSVAEASQPPPTTPSSSAATAPPPSSSSLEPTSLADAYEILKEYDDAFSKLWDEDSKSWKYVISRKNGNHSEFIPDYQAITAGAAIGATTRLLSLQEREQEFKRWQTSILSRIPDQPTFEQLGLKNRVFLLEERRKRCLEEMEGGSGGTPDRPTKKKRGDDNDDDNDDDDDMEDKEKGNDEADVDPDEKEKEKEETPIKKIQLAPRKNKSEEQPVDEEVKAEKVEGITPEVLKIIKPMSLAPIPSFYDQDLNRIRAVHGDLMGFNLIEGSRQSLTDATNQYNAAHHRSNQLFDHRTRLNQSLAFFIQKSQADLAKVHGDRGVQVAMARRQWMKQKMEHDQNRTKQFLPSTWGRSAYGTNMTQQYAQRGGIHGVVAGCLADIVDGVSLVLEGKIPNNKFANFQVPPVAANQPSAESLQQQVARSENEFRVQLEQVTTQYQQSEDTRQRAWTKMMKAKAELETLSGGPSGTTTGRQGYLDMTNHHRVPLPPLRNSQIQQMPQDVSSSRVNQVATFTPPPVVHHHHQQHRNPSMVGTSATATTTGTPVAATTTTAGAGGGNGGPSLSKYSAAKVRERMSNDGSVAPVGEPKKDRDGLYVRPAGRTRKGMKWNAVQGIWIPE